ncbi:MAG: class I SAM-dependent methyltransferase [Candidatus Krumholzibacteria bacterium]|nr:class I SAM-dependent methyltransferase [Candidatus Krumholzibacteria bacterium]MDH4338366.1 class I SAM-dependent methyltransferase [Candidatus Krumholzibacteria bacterium]MDH5271392.1 class I SAM-dependent methyltransferase [Candidatus Krumholzibacteria bacterium]
MTSYYSRKLAGRRLERCYEIAAPRVQRYFEAEIVHALSRIRPTDSVLELGCGTGRIARRVADVAARVVGIDTAAESIACARETVHAPNCVFMEMDALHLGFPNDSFDVVLCLQNGICAFRLDTASLIKEALRVTRPGGRVLFSSYADAFWEHRLAWFDAQAAEGLVGPVDHAASMDGVIVCTDGFRAGRMTPAGFQELCAKVGVAGEVTEVDESSVVCEVRKG